MMKLSMKPNPTMGIAEDNNSVCNSCRVGVCTTDAADEDAATCATVPVAPVPVADVVTVVAEAVEEREEAAESTRLSFALTRLRLAEEEEDVALAAALDLVHGALL